jgi:hypothetical protein
VTRWAPSPRTASDTRNARPAVARPVSDRDAVARGARRVRRAGIERARAAGGQERHPPPDRDELVAAEDPGAGAALAVAQKADRSGVVNDPDPRVCQDPGDQRPRDGRAGRRAVCVEDAVTAVPALPGELRTAAGVTIPADAEPLEVGHAADAVSHQHLHGCRIGEAPPNGERVGDVERRVVAGADGRRDAALRHERVRRLERAFGDERRRGAARRCLEGGVEPREPCADDQDVGAMRRSFAHGAAHISRSD